jgi:hypothetical protein
MRVNLTLLTTLTLGIVIGGLILAWLLRPNARQGSKIETPITKLPPGPVGFKMLPASAVPERA